MVCYIATDVKRYYPVGPSSGSGDMPPQVELGPDERLIAIEVSMMNADIVFRAAPRETMARKRSKGGIRPAFIESLERSLDEHAEVWAELAKH